MKFLATLAALAPITLVVLSSCEGDVSASDIVDGAKTAVEKVDDFDISKLSTEGMQEKVNEVVGQVTSKLGAIKDLDGAKAAVTQLGPMLDQVTKLKDALGGKMPDLSSLTKTVTDLTSKFAGDLSIMETLKPLLDQVRGLVG